MWKVENYRSGFISDGGTSSPPVQSKPLSNKLSDCGSPLAEGELDLVALPRQFLHAA